MFSEECSICLENLEDNLYKEIKTNTFLCIKINKKKK